MALNHSHDLTEAEEDAGFAIHLLPDTEMPWGGTFVKIAAAMIDNSTFLMKFEGDPENPYCVMAWGVPDKATSRPPFWMAVEIVRESSPEMAVHQARLGLKRHFHWEEKPLPAIPE